MALFGKKNSDPVALLAAGEFKKAIKLLEKKLEQSPNDFATRLRLAEAYEGDGRREEAGKIYRAEGEASISGGSRAQGLVLLKKAAKLLPDDADLAQRVAALDGGGSGVSTGSFSFDMDMEAPEEVPAEASAEAPQTEPTQEEAASVEEVEPPVEEPAPEVPAREEVTEIPSPAQEVAPEEAASEPAPEEAPAPESLPEEVPEPQPAAEPEPAMEVELQDLPQLEPPPAEAVEAAAAEETGEEEGPAPSRLLRPEDPVALMCELFPGITPKEASELGSTLKPRVLGTGEVLIREGEGGESLFLVMDGCLEASGSFDGTKLRLALLERCDVLGEVAFLKSVKRTATVIALKPSKVLELSREAVVARFQDRPELLERLESILDERVKNTIRVLKKRWKKR